MVAGDVFRAVRFDRYVVAMLAGRRAARRLLTSRLEARMARVALDLAHSGHAPADPDPAFVAKLRHELLMLARDRS